MPVDNHFISRLSHLHLPRVCVPIIGAEYPEFEEVRILKDYHGKDRVLTAKRK